MTDAEQSSESELTSLYRKLLAKQIAEISRLHERLDDVLDSREKAELRADQAELQLQKGACLGYELGRRCRVRPGPGAMAHPLSPQPPSSPPWDDDRIDQLEDEVRRRQRESIAAREAECVAIGKMQQERLRAEAAEKMGDELRSEIRALYYRGRP